MRNIPLILVASPGIAHTGVHVHPHDGGFWVAMIAALAVIAAAVCLARRLRR